jgi:hypothetical protein
MRYTFQLLNLCNFISYEKAYNVLLLDGFMEGMKLGFGPYMKLTAETICEDNPTIILCPGFGFAKESRSYKKIKSLSKILYEKGCQFNLATFKYPSHQKSIYSGFENDHFGISNISNRLSEIGFSDIRYLAVSYGAKVFLDFMKHSPKNSPLKKVAFIEPFWGYESLNSAGRIIKSGIDAFDKFIPEVINLEKSRRRRNLYVRSKSFRNYLFNKSVLPDRKMNVTSVGVSTNVFSHYFINRLSTLDVVSEYGGEHYELRGSSDINAEVATHLEKFLL